MDLRDKLQQGKDKFQQGKQDLQNKVQMQGIAIKHGVSSLMKKFIFLMIIVGIAYAFASYYSIIFSRKVDGVIEKVERVQVNVALMQSTDGSKNDKLSRDLFSFAVAIKEKTGEIVTASAEDRQWAVAQPGQCVEARYYPYPPWNFDKSGTFFGARLLKLTDCTTPQQPQ